MVEKEVTQWYKVQLKWFDTDKGFGFISQNGTDVFSTFLKLNLMVFKSLEDGQKVQFDVEPDMTW